MYNLTDKEYPALKSTSTEAGEPLSREDVEKALSDNETRYLSGEIDETRYKSTKRMFEMLLPLFIPEYNEHSM